MNRFLLVICISGVIISGPACNVSRGPTITTPGVQRFIPSTIPTASPSLTPHAPTPLPTSTQPPLLTSRPPADKTPSSSPPAPTKTGVLFLPADLHLISPRNVSNLKPVATLPERGASVVAYSPDSRLVAAGLFVSNYIKIWDLDNGQEVFSLRGHIDPRIVSYLAFSPDGSQLASGAQGWDALNDSLILWDANSGRELQRFDGFLGAISPDWRLAALTQREQERGVTLILSELGSGREIHTLQAPGDIYGVSFSPQGRQVAAKMLNVFQDLFSFWSVESGRLDRTLYDWAGFTYSPDSRFITALLDTGSGMEKGELNIFDAETFRWIKTLRKDADTLWFAYPVFSPDGQILAASLGDHIILWETQTWKELASLPTSGPAGCAFSPDGRLFTTYTQSGQAKVWGVVGGQ